MKKNRCLYCYELLNERETDYHPQCIRKFFGTDTAPKLQYKLSELKSLAKKVVRSQITIPGVQTKLSLGVEKVDGNHRFTIVGLWDEYILKPASEQFEYLPENESLSMKLADLFGISTVPNSLIRFSSGELAYITKRIDRLKNQKLPMEDMAQLTGKLTEDKYKGSLEQLGKAIKQFSNNQGLDLVNFFEIVLFSFLTGNADMHLKNFSIYLKDGLYRLTPAYDLLSTRLVIPESQDNEESALTLNGKKRKLNKIDFELFAENIGVSKKTVKNIFSKFDIKIQLTVELISKSFLSKKLKDKYMNLISERWERLS